MAAKVLKETKSLSAIEITAEGEPVSCVKCYCCGLTEECTPPYIDGVRERYQGRWICGLCAEAVKEEGLRSQRDHISTDEALKRHVKFCQQFRSSNSSPPNNPTQELILAMKHLLLRTLDSPSPSPSKDPLRSCRPLGRSHSCFPAMQGTTKAEARHSDSRIVDGREVITSE